jgi:predicted AAA+ superfamily ATPase
MEIIKYCSKCDTSKPIEQFSKSKRSADRYSYTCKACIKEYQLANKEKLKAYQREYQLQYKADNKEQLYEYLRVYQKTIGKEKHHTYIRNWKKRNPEKVKQYLKNTAERKQAKND